MQAGGVVEPRRLHGSDAAVTVRLGPAGHSAHSVVTSGSFAGAPERIGNYWILDAADLEEALHVTRNWPAGGAIEIKPIREE